MPKKLSRFHELKILADWMEAQTQGDRPINRALGVFKTCFYAGGTLFVAGNGGSAAMANHFAAELVGIGLSCLSLVNDQAVTTALGNDYGYENVFVKQLKAVFRDNDVFLGITTSGKSENIIEAFSYVKGDLDWIAVLLGGPSLSAPAVWQSSFYIQSPFDNTQRTQEMHLAVIHYWYEELKLWKEQRSTKRAG